MLTIFESWISGFVPKVGLRRLRSGPVLILALILSGAMPTASLAGPSAMHSKKAPGRLYGLRQMTSLKAESDRRLFSKIDEQWQTPLIGGDGSLAYAATGAGELFALWMDSGKILWRRNKLTAVGRAFYQRGDQLLFGSGQDLIAVDRFSGKTAWTLAMGGMIGNRFAVHGDVAIIPIRPNAFVAVDLATHKILWRAARPQPAGITVRGQATATIDNNRGRVFLGFSDGAVQSLDFTTGKLLWMKQLGLTSKPFADVDTQPILQDGGETVVVASYNAGVFGLNAETGRQRWHNQRELAITSWFAFKNGQRFIASNGEGQIFGFRPQAKQRAWTYTIESGRAGSPVGLQNNWVAISVSEGATVILDRETGAPRQLFNPGSGLNVPVVSLDRDLILLSNKGNMFFYRLGEGTGISAR